MGFKRIRSINLPEWKQGELFYRLKGFQEMPSDEKRRVHKLCRQCAGEHADALFEFLTTYKTSVKISVDHYVSQTQLYTYRKRFYETWYEEKTDSERTRRGAPTRAN